MPDVSSKHAAGSNATIFKILGHPLRSRIMLVLSELEASASEIAEQLDEPLHNVAYHVREMAKVKPAIIEFVGFAPGKRGGHMKVYRACARPHLEVDDWERLPRLLREVNSVSVARLIVGDLIESINSGTFDADPGRTMIRVRGSVDREGWEKLEALGIEYLEGISEVLSGSADRLAESGEQGIQVSAAALAFETPPAQRRSDLG